MRIGVIGTGGRGVIAVHAHHPEIGVQVVACCDINDAVFNQAREHYGKDIFTTSDFQELLDLDLDAVFVATPDYLHEEHAIAALEAGKAVYLEKPMAITIEGCDRILATAARTGTKLYLGHNMRHMPFVLKMKELIDEGAIGEVKSVWCRHFVGHGGDFYFKDWHSERQYSTSLLLQKACHDLDVMHWLAGGYTQRVQAFGALTLYDQVDDRRAADDHTPPKADLVNWPPLDQTGLSPRIDVEDLSVMNMILDNGVIASYQQCHYTPDYWRNYTFIGTEGRIENYGDGGSETVIKLWNKRSWEHDPEPINIPVDVVTGTHGGADPRIIAEFLDYVRGVIKPTTSVIAARNSVAAGCAATDSLRSSGNAIDVPSINEDVLSYFSAI